MNLFEAGNVLRQHLADGSIPLPRVYPNDAFPTVSTHPSGFLYVRILGAGSEQISLGTGASERYWRDHGVLSIAVHVPRTSAVGGAEQIASNVRSMFMPETWAHLGLHIERTEAGADGGNTDDGAWYYIPVTVQFHVDRKE